MTFTQDMPKEQRTIANAKAEIILEIGGKKVSFERKGAGASIYHNPAANVKLVGDNGMEIVINRKTGKLDLKSQYRGTFNFATGFPLMP